MTRKRFDFCSRLFNFAILGTRRRGPFMKSWVLGASAAFIAASIAASPPANAGLVTYDVNLTFNAGDTPFSANGVTGMISGPGTIQGTFTVDSLTNVIETASIVAQAGTTVIADYTLGPGYSGLTGGYNFGYTDAGFSEPGYETPDFEALFFYPSGSTVYTGDDVFGSKIEFYNGLGQRIAEFQLSGTILPAAAVPEPATWVMLLAGVGGLAVMRVTRRRPVARLSESTTDRSGHPRENRSRRLEWDQGQRRAGERDVESRRALPHGRNGEFPEISRDRGGIIIADEHLRPQRAGSGTASFPRRARLIRAGPARRGRVVGDRRARRGL